MRVHDEIEILVQSLQSNEGVVRAHARSSLVKAGKSAVPYLINLLSSPHDHLRWEACKALGEIADPSAAEYLVRALEDDNMDVRWVAAEALIALSEDALPPLLRALETRFDSIFLREGAEHVLHTLQRRFPLDRTVDDVIEALRDGEPKISVAWAAMKALDALRMTGSA